MHCYFDNYKKHTIDVDLMHCLLPLQLAVISVMWSSVSQPTHSVENWCS